MPNGPSPLLAAILATLCPCEWLSLGNDRQCRCSQTLCIHSFPPEHWKLVCGTEPGRLNHNQTQTLEKIEILVETRSQLCDAEASTWSQDTRRNVMCRSKAQRTEEKAGLELAAGAAQLSSGGTRPGFEIPRCSTGKWLLSVKRHKGTTPF